MRKILVLIFLSLVVSGCATYKFQKPASAGAEGYLACYNDKPLLEYTVGPGKSLPDLALAKERFKRRRSTVEYYYKKMNIIESRLKEFFWDPPAMMVDLLGGVLRWPFIAVADYKYNRNPEYKARVDKLDEQKEELEKARINALKEKLAGYISEDLNNEPFSRENVVPVPQIVKAAQAPEVVPPEIQEVAATPLEASVPVEQIKEPEAVPESQTALPLTLQTKELEPAKEPQTPEVASQLEPAAFQASPAVEVGVVLPSRAQEEIKPPVVEEPGPQKILEPPVAIITANPLKGFSPLTVKFSGQKSYSKTGKIVAYDWSFGDGDTSTKKNPENTYWSTTFGSRNFTATLTVRDDAGIVSSSTVVIEVSTP